MRTRPALLTLAVAASLGATACARTTGETAPTSAPTTEAPTTTTTEVRRTTTTVRRTTTTTAATTTTLAPTTTVAPTTVPPPPATAPPPALLAPTVPLVPLRPGARGDSVAVLQQRLLDLGYWLDAIDHRYGPVTVQAVMAFQKDRGLQADGIAGPDTTGLLNQPLPRAQGAALEGDLVEINKTKQVLYLIHGGQTALAVNTSTGTGTDYTEFSEKEGREISGAAITPEGMFKVNRERPEGWWTGELGDLYRPKYFRGGVAVHGSNRIPNYPASHGCVRVTTAFMDFVWTHNLMPMRSVVWVHA